MGRFPDAYIAPSCPSQCVSPYDKDMVVQTWLGPHTSSIIKLGHRVIVTGVTLYLDVGRSTFFADNPSWGGTATWRQIYQFDPDEGVRDVDKHMVLGSEVCAWGETIDETNFESLVWPRASAFASSMWNRPLQFDSNNMEIETGVWKRMMRHREDLRKDRVQASPLAPNVCNDISPDAAGNSGFDLCARYAENRKIKWPSGEFNCPGPLCTGGPGSPCSGPLGQSPLPECKERTVIVDAQRKDAVSQSDCQAQGGVWRGGECYDCPAPGKLIGGQCHKTIQDDCPANSICVRTIDENWAEKRACMCPCDGFETSPGLQQQKATYAYDANNWQLYSNL